MGGYGSGTRGTYESKMTVEACLTFSISTFGRIRGACTGKMTWSSQGEEVGAVAYAVSGTSVLLTYATDGEEVRLPIGLDTTRQYFGGLRFWLLCPLIKGGKACRRRVAKLHLPPGGKYFGCRHCYDLTYESSQEAHKYDSAFASLGASMGLDINQVSNLLKNLDRNWN